MSSCQVITVALMLCAGTAAAGCGAARPSKYYQLNTPNEVSSQADPEPLPVILLIGGLTSSHLYREDRIVYSTNGETMGTYEYQRWAEPPTEMIRDMLERELRASGRYRGVTGLRSAARGDYMLRGRLYDFKEVTGSTMIGRVAMEFELRETKTGATVWSHYYAHDEPVSGKDVAAVVAALDRGAQGIVGQVKAAVEQYFSAHPPTKATP
jgi:ABC-type uncharacterized transport system auxiliary subunit